MLSHIALAFPLIADACQALCYAHPLCDSLLQSLQTRASVSWAVLLMHTQRAFLWKQACSNRHQDPWQSPAMSRLRLWQCLFPFTDEVLEMPSRACMSEQCCAES